MHGRTSTRAVRAVTWRLAGLVAIGGVAGCSALGDPGTSSAPTPAAPSETVGPAEQAATTSPTAENAPATAPAGTAFASRTARLDSATVTANVYPVTRGERTSTLDVELMGRDPEATFTAHTMHRGAPLDLSSSPNALQLIDRRHAKAYLVARTPDGECVCSPDYFSSTSSHFWVSATFAAPPADVTTVDVVIPGFGTVSDVPVV